MTDAAETVPPISPKALSDALAALGAYAEPPTASQLAAIELAEGRARLAARLANASCWRPHLSRVLRQAPPALSQPQR